MSTKKVGEVAGRILGTLAKLPTRSVKAPRSPQPSSEGPQPAPHPARTKWQRKWLELDCWCPQLASLARLAEQFCSRWWNCDRRKSVFVLFGPPGSGKTHVARRLFRFCSSAGTEAFDRGRGKTWRSVPWALYKKWPEVAERLKAGGQWEMEEMREVDLLVLDDIGAEDDSFKAASNKLCQLLSVRERKFTVVTTNVEPAAWGERFDVRIADRLVRNAVHADLSEVGSYALRS